MSGRVMRAWAKRNLIQAIYRQCVSYKFSPHPFTQAYLFARNDIVLYDSHFITFSNYFSFIKLP